MKMPGEYRREQAIAAENIKQAAKRSGIRQKSKFKGFGNLVNANYTVQSFTCDRYSTPFQDKEGEIGRLGTIILRVTMRQV